MRLDEEFKKSGYFWLPSNPEKRIPGTLIIKDGGNVELEVVGLFDDSVNGALNGENKLKRIVGDIEKHGLVTLDDCFYKNRNISFGGGISKSTIRVTRAFVGVAYEKNEIISFNHLNFSVEGIDEWVGLSGIKVEHQQENKPGSITYNPPKETTFNLNNGMTLNIWFEWAIKLPGFPIRKEAKITQKTYFKLSSDQECSLNDFVSTAYKITTLLGFAIDKTVCIEKVTAMSEAIRKDVGNGKTVPVPISIYYSSLPFTESRPKIDWHSMLFRFGHIQNDAERIVNNWLDAYDEIAPALNLYFSAKTGSHKYLDGKFLALAQGLETYHRRTSSMKLMDENVFENVKSELIEKCPEEHRDWLTGRLMYGNEVSLSRRIKSIIEPFKELLGTGRERDKLIRAIVNTRNYLTHYDQSLKAMAASGTDLWGLCLKMEAIFQLHLLQILGFTETEVKSVFESSNELQQKLKEI